MGRKYAREVTMQLLFQMDINGDYSENVKKIFLSDKNLSENEMNYINNSTDTIIKYMDTIDNYIEKYSQGWKINRMAKVDLAILRLAVHEIVYREDIPVEVSINEALEISKKYSSDKSSKFINGLLGSFERSWNKNNG